MADQFCRLLAQMIGQRSIDALNPSFPVHQQNQLAPGVGRAFPLLLGARDDVEEAGIAVEQFDDEKVKHSYSKQDADPQEVPGIGENPPLALEDEGGQTAQRRLF